MILKQSTLDKAYAVLIDALGNSEELLAIHDSSLGRTTKKNELTGKMYEEEINKTLCVMMELKPFITK